MAITLDGIKVSSMSIQRDKEDGRLKMTGNYELVSSAGVTLARQSFNGYNDVSVGQSPETARLLNELMASVQKDLNSTLGLG